MPSLLTVAIGGTTVVVVATISAVLWRARISARTAFVAVASGGVLAAWALTAGVLAYRGFFIARDAESFPTVGISLIVSMAGLSLALLASPSLRILLKNQKHLILLNLWRLAGIVFLILMWTGRVPALWALPTGIGDILVGAAAPWVASQLATPHGRRRAVIFNIFGMADLVVAIALGITTSVGPAQIFHTIPTSELVAQFPLALVPTFLVPLAFMLHIVSLWQLLGQPFEMPSSSRGTRSGTAVKARAST